MASNLRPEFLLWPLLTQQQPIMEEITIYKFQLETIIDALRMTSNALGCDKQETCLDRHVIQAKRYADNALKGDKDKEVRYGSKLS